MAKNAILIVSHGDLGKSLIRTSELIMGAQENLAAIGLELTDSIQDLPGKIEETIKEFQTSKDVLVLLDLFGGSPCNSVLKLVEKYGIECVVGVNLPMLLETVSRNDDDISIKELAEIACKAGAESVRNIGVEFRNRKKSS